MVFWKNNPSPPSNPHSDSTNNKRHSNTQREREHTFLEYLDLMNLNKLSLILLSFTAAIAVLLAFASAATATQAKKQRQQPTPLTAPRVRPYKTASLTMTQPGYPPVAPNHKQYSGYFNIQRNTTTRYFAWMISAAQNPDTAPVCFWFTGGPGCASTLATATENGPFTVQSDGSFVPNPYAWTRTCTMVYVDQPAGVGYSTTNSGGESPDLTVVADDMYVFFKHWAQQFPQLAKSSAVYVIGESFGGAYVPWIAHRLWQGIRAQDIVMNLKGVAIGNGLFNGAGQFASGYYELAYEWCIKVKGAPCVTKAVYEQMRSSSPICQSMSAACNANSSNYNLCADAASFCQQSQMGPYQAAGHCFYDITKKSGCENGGMNAAAVFFNNPVVQQSLLGSTAPPVQWSACNYTVNGMLLHSWMHSRDAFITEMLDDDILPVKYLMYNGLNDFAVNWIGMLGATLNLVWTHQWQFSGAPKQQWYGPDNRPAGWLKTVGGKNGKKQQLTFAGILNAGHMSPADAPANVQRMIETWTLGDGLFFDYAGPERPTN